MLYSEHLVNVTVHLALPSNRPAKTLTSTNKPCHIITSENSPREYTLLFIPQLLIKLADFKRRIMSNLSLRNAEWGNDWQMARFGTETFYFIFLHHDLNDPLIL